MSNLVFFSSVSENTKRFVDRLEIPAERIPLRHSEGPRQVEEPYVLITPTYGGGSWNTAVPRQVANFLNDPHNRSLIRGVIASGNTNFGEAYCLAGRVIASKCRVPQLYRFELIGTDHDVRAVSQRLEMFWQTQHQVA